METILVVDDDRGVASVLSEMLKEEGYNAIIVGDGIRALKEIKKSSPILVLLDIFLPGMDGLEVLEKIKRNDANLPVIMITGYGDIKGAVKAMKLGAYDYITKPIKGGELIILIKSALRVQNSNKRGELLRKNIVGKSSHIKSILYQVRKIAPTDNTVIIQGKSGTGKELIAHRIYQESKRNNGPFVTIDCGVVPESLFESEFFGYEKGAYTGADAQKVGLFEMANGGTLFLDEISNLSLASQKKFLRVIEERELRHLGSNKTINVDIRIIVATNIDLRCAIREGGFREDLFHRLNEFLIEILPLCERKADIPVLANHFLDDAKREFNKQVKEITSAAMKLLLDYQWPGNVRELNNVIRKAVLLTDSECISPSILSKIIKTTGQRVPYDQRDLSSMSSFQDVIQREEKVLIEKAITEAKGNISKAAKFLHLNRKTLYRKMKKLDLTIGRMKFFITCVSIPSILSPICPHVACL